MPFPELFEVLISLLRVAIGCILLMAGVVKIGEGRTFADTILKYRVLPVVLVGPISLLIHWIEVALGASLITGLYTEAASSVSGLLFLVFLSATLSAMIRGITLDCSCFGLLYRERVGSGTAVRDISLVLAAALVAAFDTGAYSFWRILFHDSISLSEIVVVSTTVLCSGTAIWLSLRAVSAYRSVVASEERV